MVKAVVAVVAIVLFAGCRDAFDPGKPIDVVAIGSWSGAQRADLDHAAACWNLGFGLDYRTASTSDGQRVEVEFNDVECLYSAWALTTDGFTSQVSLCPAHFPSATDGTLFGVLTHELGHVAGIPADVEDDPDAIMGGDEPISIPYRLGQPIFSPTDRALFASYNPNFTPTPTCQARVAFVDDEFGCSCDGGFASAAANAIAFDSQGNLYVAGHATGIMTFAGNELAPIGLDDVLVATYAPDGSYRWAQRFGAASQSAHATAIAIDAADNVYIAGLASGAIDFGGAAAGMGGNTFTASFDTSGAYRWSRADPSDFFDGTPALAVAGGVVFVETDLFGKATYSPSVTIDTGEGSAAVMLAADSTTGALQWVRDHDVTDETIACGVVATPTWVVFAACDNTPHGWTTRFLSLTTAGVARWSAAGPDMDNPGLALDTAGNLYVAGWPDDTEIGEPIDMVVASYDVDGIARWSSPVAGGTNLVSSSLIRVAVDANGRVAVDGRIGDGIESTDDDELVATFASDGTALSSQLIAGTGVTTTQAIAFDRDGVLDLAGGYPQTSNIGAVDFGHAPVIENGGLFVLSVMP